MDQRINKILKYIQENLSGPINMTELADMACWSPVHFYRRFKHTTGLSPSHYVELHKIKYSLELLKDPIQVQDIAFQLGFTNYETFSRAFKRHCKIAPADVQYLLHHLRKETDPEAPLAISVSSRLSDLEQLVNNAFMQGIILPEQLPALQLCIITPKVVNTRSRKPEDKYQLSFEPDLKTRLLEAMKY